MFHVDMSFSQQKPSRYQGSNDTIMVIWDVNDPQSEVGLFLISNVILVDFFRKMTQDVWANTRLISCSSSLHLLTGVDITDCSNGR